MPETTKQDQLRELDRQIAERVMGWEPVADQKALAPFAYKRPDGHIVHPYSAPNYSADIADAMIVVREMCVAGWSFACTLYQGKLPYASFCRGTAKSSRNAESETLPEAICRAALKAMENQL